MTWKRSLLLFGLALVMAALSCQPAWSQALATGSIRGTVEDPSGASVPDAKITVTNKGTNEKLNLRSTSSGTFDSGAVVPGVYIVHVEAPNFKAYESTVAVQVGGVATVPVKLEVGATSAVVEVTASAVQVNEEQPTVQDVLTRQDIEQLPANGRNFLDLASLEPGVQIQDGGTFDPTKNGYSSISFGGRYGRTARIEVDGLDISDETVGTTTQNIPMSGIDEFQVATSSLDMSTELTSSGAVNIVTQSGTNTIHGEAFYYGRSDQLSAKIAPTQLDFGRKQFGASLGGPLVKDKLFAFIDFERTDQNLANPVITSGPFAPLAGSYGSPFLSRQYMGRLDYNFKPGWTAFFRFNYDQNYSVRGFAANIYTPFSNTDHTRQFAGGTDFLTGHFTHSIRVGYMKFHNQIGDASAYNPAPGIGICIATFADFACEGSDEFGSGASLLAPQATFQTNKQAKYDGSYVFGNHTIRFGTSINRILGGGFASFFGLAPVVSAVDTPAAEAFAATGTYTCPGGATGVACPLNWPTQTIIMGNGLGYFTEIPQFGLPGGGQYDTRFSFYVGDVYRFRHPHLTVTYSLHYDRDTGRQDSDLPAIPLLDTLEPGLGNPIHQPDHNFAPELGIAWDPTGSGKTVIRAGAGIYFENVIFNNVLFDRPARLPTGLFFGDAAECYEGSGGGDDGVACGNVAIGSQVANIIAAQADYQAASIAGGPAANGSYIGNAYAASPNSTGQGLIGPNYRTPFSEQMNIGVQRQLGRGTVLSVDYVRNVGLHYLLGVDVNHVGAARTLNVANAQAAIAATNGSFGCGSSYTAAATDCAIENGATIVDYAGNGLDSGNSCYGGVPAAPNGCPNYAFPGLNPTFGQVEVLYPIGRSMYNGLLFELKSNIDHPAPGIHHMNLIASYTLSRFDSMGEDQDFIPPATDWDTPTHYYGPSSLDRTDQLSVGAVLDLPGTTRMALATHWLTAVPVNLALQSTGAPGDIFVTDATGDGTTGDILPGYNIGAFGRNVKVSNLNSVIDHYDSTLAGTPTPAGQALIGAGLMTAAQLSELGGVLPSIADAPPGEVGVSPLFTFDMHLSWELPVSKLIHAVPERVVVEPQISAYNLFNFQNYDPASDVLLGSLSSVQTLGTVNGTTRATRSNKITPGAASGVNWYGVPRQFEAGVKLTF
jgi:Carboxypeptidase regulatory-like domain